MGNLWLSSQITGLVIWRGGYINHNRVCCRAAPVLDSGLDFFDAIIISPGLLLTSGNGRYDADFVTVLEGGVHVLQKTDIFLVHIDVDKTADAAGIVDQPFADAGIEACLLYT